MAKKAGRQKGGRRIGSALAAWLGGLALAWAPQWAGAESIVVASTTSTEQSGLFGHLLPSFQASSGIEVKVVALGTGQALEVGRRGDADVVFVHDRAAEEKFVAAGHGLERHDVMYNDFVLVGPKADPAGAQGGDIVAALTRVAHHHAPFVSRGDRSGTHAAELRFWQEAGLADGQQGTQYKSCGCGMGPALNMGASLGAYVLTDRGTWLSFRNKGDLIVLVEGDHRLFNQYGVMIVNPARHPQVRLAAARTFVDWLRSEAGQARIASYRIDGEPLFFPNARR